MKTSAFPQPPGQEQRANHKKTAVFSRKETGVSKRIFNFPTLDYKRYTLLREGSSSTSKQHEHLSFLYIVVFIITSYCFISHLSPSTTLSTANNNNSHAHRIIPRSESPFPDNLDLDLRRLRLRSRIATGRRRRAGTRGHHRRPSTIVHDAFATPERTPDGVRNVSQVRRRGIESECRTVG
jgi:hypothetical protein